jgi:diadenosine tetraphosphate (Ap4A) HIT family hydrolase
VTKNYNCEKCPEPRSKVIFEGKFVYLRLSNPSFAPYHLLILPKAHRESIEFEKLLSKLYEP